MRTSSQGVWLALPLAMRGAELVRAECESHGGKVVDVPTDMAERSQCEMLIRKAARIWLPGCAGRQRRRQANFDEVVALDIFEKIVRFNHLGSMDHTNFAVILIPAMAGFFDALRKELALAKIVAP